MVSTRMFSIRMTPPEKAMLAELAKELHRSQSEVIRLLIRETLIEFKSQQSIETASPATNLPYGENNHA